jgi:hypothetical protein
MVSSGFRNRVLGALMMAGLVGAAPGTRADQVISDNLIVTGELLCVGLWCANNEPLIPGRDGLKIKGTDLALRFDDTSFGAGNPSRDWQITINETIQFGSEVFRVQDVTAGTSPFTIVGPAPNHALVIADNGHIGLGTQLPLRDLHVIAPLQPTLRLEQSGVPGAPARSWDIAPGVSGIAVMDATGGTSPLEIRNGAPSQSFLVAGNGNVGLGTNGPLGKLHTRGAGTQLVYFESSDGGPVQVRFRTNSENRRFLAVNNANEVKSQIVFGDDQIQFLGENISQEWLRISSAGIVSSGPTCNPNPCDATFDPEAFTVPPIEERAAYMWENMHLPAVGPTAPGEPFNLTEKTAGMLHELEVAHIYIAQLHQEQDQLKSQIAALKADHEIQLSRVLGRLDSLELSK